VLYQLSYLSTDCEEPPEASVTLPEGPTGVQRGSAFRRPARPVSGAGGPRRRVRSSFMRQGYQRCAMGGPRLAPADREIHVAEPGGPGS
jgi:hypothetical protein